VLESEVFILKLVAYRKASKRQTSNSPIHTVNALSSGTVMVGKVTSLAHKLRDDSVESGTLKVQAYKNTC
jgi:hypothetical protein